MNPMNILIPGTMGMEYTTPKKNRKNMTIIINMINMEKKARNTTKKSMICVVLSMDPMDK
jgi:hypothetical protein